ncbi:MAG: hypothetical protein L0027_15275, partial [Candidatus Rokubacteria bacterium]|nr:hypothetical protein [Candidatus Rokubacteria bacterium]
MIEVGRRSGAAPSRWGYRAARGAARPVVPLAALALALALASIALALAPASASAAGEDAAFAVS